MSSYKNPPKLNEDMQYEAWVKEVNLWSLCCKLEKEEQGPALALSLSGHARQAAMDIDTNLMKSADGLQAVINKLDGLYLKDVNQRIYVALKTFERFRRTDEVSMDDYLNQFDLRYNKLKAHGIILPDIVLGYRMLESANLSQSRNELVRISAGCMSYDEIKKQLRKLEDIAASSEGYEQIKTEDNEVMFQYDHHPNQYGNGNRARGGRVSRGTRGGGRSRGSRGAYHNDGAGARNNFRGSNTFHGNNARGASARGANRGRGTNRGRGRGACHSCGGLDHWARECPERYENDVEGEEVVEDVEIVDIEI